MARVIDLDTNVNMADLLQFTSALRSDYQQILRTFETLADNDRYFDYALSRRNDLPDWAQQPVVLPREAAWRMEIDMNDYEPARYRGCGRGRDRDVSRGRSRERERGCGGCRSRHGCYCAGDGYAEGRGGGGGGGGPGLHYHNDRHYHDHNHNRWGGGMGYDEFLADGVRAAFERGGWGGGPRGGYGGYGGWGRRRYW